MEFVFASSNAGKIREIEDLIGNRFQIKSQEHWGIAPPEETASTFLENALIKAKHGAAKSGKYTIADDSGLVVPGLNFEPGIYSARYAGNHASDKDNRDKIIDKLNELKLEELDAYYVCVLVGIKNHDDPMPIIAQGEIHGKVSINSSGEGGFGCLLYTSPSPRD